MRLWHKDLIPVLPRQQLLGQWRECCLIYKNIYEIGEPNHLLVNRIMEYPLQHFFSYINEIINEMIKREYRCNTTKVMGAVVYLDLYNDCPSHEELFKEWHNDRYLLQCYYNLQEKYDCGGITEEEWELIINYIKSKTSN